MEEKPQGTCQDRSTLSAWQIAERYKKLRTLPRFIYNVLIISALLLGTMAAAHAQSFSFTYETIDFRRAARETRIFGINNAGDVVGIYKEINLGPFHGFLPQAIPPLL